MRATDLPSEKPRSERRWTDPVADERPAACLNDAVDINIRLYHDMTDHGCRLLCPSLATINIAEKSWNVAGQAMN